MQIYNFFYHEGIVVKLTLFDYIEFVLSVHG